MEISEETEKNARKEAEVLIATLPRPLNHVARELLEMNFCYVQQSKERTVAVQEICSWGFTAQQRKYLEEIREMEQTVAEAVRNKVIYTLQKAVGTAPQNQRQIDLLKERIKALEKQEEDHRQKTLD